MCEMWIIKQLDWSVFVTPVKNFEKSTFIELNICKNPEVKNVSSTHRKHNLKDWARSNSGHVFTADCNIYVPLQKKLVVLTTEWLPQLQSSCGYESFTLVLETNWMRQPEKQVPNVQATILATPPYTENPQNICLYKCTSKLQ